MQIQIQTQPQIWLRYNVKGDMHQSAADDGAIGVTQTQNRNTNRNQN